MGPYTGLDLARKIFDQTNTKKNNGHLSLAVLAFPSTFSDRTLFLLGKTQTNPALAIVEVIRKLEAIGAEVIGIPCNTAHAPEIYNVILKELKKINSNVCIVHMINEVGTFMHDHYPQIKKIGLLATKGTYTTDLYPANLQQYDLDVLPMDEPMQNRVHDIIYNSEDGIKAEFDPANVTVKEKLLNVIEELKERGAQAVILGCTEIPLVLTEKKIRGVIIIDPTLILARALIKIINQKMLKSY